MLKSERLSLPYRLCGASILIISSLRLMEHSSEITTINYQESEVNLSTVKIYGIARQPARRSH
jgi:hypothetical protein